jgi:hypothetical protein
MSESARPAQPSQTPAWHRRPGVISVTRCRPGLLMNCRFHPIHRCQSDDLRSALLHSSRPAGAQRQNSRNVGAMSQPYMHSFTSAPSTRGRASIRRVKSTHTSRTHETSNYH